MLDKALEGSGEEGKWLDDCPSEHHQAKGYGWPGKATSRALTFRHSPTVFLGTFPGSGLPTLTSHHEGGSLWQNASPAEDAGLSPEADGVPMGSPCPSPKVRQV